MSFDFFGLSLYNYFFSQCKSCSFFLVFNEFLCIWIKCVSIVEFFVFFEQSLLTDFVNSFTVEQTQSISCTISVWHALLLLWSSFYKSWETCGGILVFAAMFFFDLRVLWLSYLFNYGSMVMICYTGYFKELVWWQQDCIGGKVSKIHCRSMMCTTAHRDSQR